ncbi:hypothetical protein HNP00_000015 [Arthrobacter sp. AZCC_0090]|nr:hypothetical protein [Arthrobacter sp. AZCC_0090]
MRFESHLGHSMTKERSRAAVCRAKEAADSVNTYVCLMALPGLPLDTCNFDDIPSLPSHSSHCGDDWTAYSHPQSA